jgi:hypothetical protein
VFTLSAIHVGIPIAHFGEYWRHNVEVTETPIDTTPCGDRLPDLEIPMINTMVSCLRSEHRRLNDLTMQLAFAATKLARNPDADTARQQAFEVWNEIRRELWPHLQVEEELVFSWGETHNAIPATLLDTLRTERGEMHTLVAALAESDREQPSGNSDAVARTLQALAQTLDSHVERYDGEVLPSILRALFRK